MTGAAETEPNHIALREALDAAFAELEPRPEFVERRGSRDHPIRHLVYRVGNLRFHFLWGPPEFRFEFSLTLRTETGHWKSLELSALHALPAIGSWWDARAKAQRDERESLAREARFYAELIERLQLLPDLAPLFLRDNPGVLGSDSKILTLLRESGVASAAAREDRRYKEAQSAAGVEAGKAYFARDYARVIARLTPYRSTLDRVDAWYLEKAEQHSGASGSTEDSGRGRPGSTQTTPEPNAANEREKTRSARRAGLWKLAVGGGGWILCGLLFYAMQSSDWTPKASGANRLLILLALPGAWALAGLLELATGRSFASLGARWEALSGWQRGLIGLAVVVAAFATMILGVAILFGDF